MVAASSGRSNVPPDNLQAAPILAFVATCADEFGIWPRAGWRDAQPGETRQDHAARAQPRRLPAAVPTLPLDGPTCSDAQDPAPGISAPERQPFVAAKTGPGNGDNPLQNGGDGQQGHERKTRQE